jgi:hypothetical protein
MLAKFGRVPGPGQLVRIWRDSECLPSEDRPPTTRRKVEEMDESKALADLNARFVEAFRRGSRELLEPILSPSFVYLDGATGERWTQERYEDNLRGNPSPSLTFDQLSVHVEDDTAVVSARTSRRPGAFSRYVDTYGRRDGEWRCVHACVWPLPPPA